jgi:hypothetical protein
VIVPHPGDGKLYYVFKANLEHGGIEPIRMHCSVVDMSLEGGLGRVISKAFDIIPHVGHLLTVTTHANDKSYWTITHDAENNSFYSIHVSESGISEVVTSTLGPTYGDDENLLPRSNYWKLVR